MKNPIKLCLDHPSKGPITKYTKMHARKTKLSLESVLWAALLGDLWCTVRMLSAVTLIYRGSDNCMKKFVF